MKEGAAVPFGKIDVVNFSCPRWVCEITVDTAFDYWGAVFTYANTRAPRPNNQATV